MAEIRNDEFIEDTGLSTATLAHADELASLDERNGDGFERTAIEDDRLYANEVKTSEAMSSPNEQGALFSADETKNLRAQWDAVQVGFVDEPRQAVARADALVAGAMKRLAEMFAEERAQLEGQWDRGDHVSTEELRVTLRRYRAFFGRLLTV
jgi:hypothetical protein